MNQGQLIHYTQSLRPMILPGAHKNVLILSFLKPEQKKNDYFNNESILDIFLYLNAAIKYHFKYYFFMEEEAH